MAKKFDEHLHVDKSKSAFDKGRMICMCETHKKRIGHCKCQDINPCIPYTIRKWGTYHQLMKEVVFTEQEIIDALNDYE